MATRLTLFDLECRCTKLQNIGCAKVVGKSKETFSLEIADYVEVNLPCKTDLQQDFTFLQGLPDTIYNI